MSYFTQTPQVGIPTATLTVPQADGSVRVYTLAIKDYHLSQSRNVSPVYAIGFPKSPTLVSGPTEPMTIEFTGIVLGTEESVPHMQVFHAEDEDALGTMRDFLEAV